MKQIFRIGGTLIFGAIGAMFVTSISVHAQLPDAERLRQFTEQSSKNVEIRSKLCERYTTGRFGSNFGQKEASLRSSLSERGTDLAQKRQEADQQRDDARLTADAKRQEHYAKLLELADSDEKKVAIVEFQQTVEQAVFDRRSALDAARIAYQAGVDALIAEQKAAYELATAELKLATQQAIDKAKASCEAGVSSSEVSATLKAELSAAKEAFKNATKGKRASSEELAKLKAIRNLAYEAAKSTFTETMEQARLTLKDALSSEN